MIVKNLILRNNFQRLLSKYFKQKHLPPPIINELRGFLCLLYRESDDWFNLVQSTISLIIIHFFRLERRKNFGVGIIHF